MKHIHFYDYLFSCLWCTVSADNSQSEWVTVKGVNKGINIAMSLIYELIEYSTLFCIDVVDEWWTGLMVAWAGGWLRMVSSLVLCGPGVGQLHPSDGSVRSGPWPQHCPSFNTPLPPAAALTTDNSHASVTAHYNRGSAEHMAALTRHASRLQLIWPYNFIYLQAAIGQAN